jgi:hypothetical protein
MLNNNNTYGYQYNCYISSMSDQRRVDRLLSKTPKTMILEEDDKLYNMLIKELVNRIISAVVL